MDVTDPAHGVSLHVARTPRTPAQCLDPKVKSLNYLNNILARIEANRAGCDEALMLNLDGNVCEGSVDNVFIVTDGVLRTPPLTDGMLEGITRAVVIDVAARAGIACEQTSLRVGDLLRADECFLTGTGAELIPVRRIDGQLLPVAGTPLLPVIMRGFRDSIAQYCAKR
jgi:branched-chain amino acid aminotransferase